MSSSSATRWIEGQIPKEEVDIVRKLMDQAGDALEQGNWLAFTKLLPEGMGEGRFGEGARSLQLAYVPLEDLRMARQRFALHILFTKHGSVFLSALHRHGDQAVTLKEAYHERTAIYLALTQVLPVLRPLMRYQSTAAIAYLLNSAFDVILPVCNVMVDNFASGTIPPSFSDTAYQTLLAALFCLIQKPDAGDLIDPIIRPLHAGEILTSGNALQQSKASIVRKTLSNAPKEIRDAIPEDMLHALVHILEPDTSLRAGASHVMTARERLAYTILNDHRRQLQAPEVTVCHHCGRFRSSMSVETTELMKPYPACSRCRKACFCSPDCQRADWEDTDGHKKWCKLLEVAFSPI